MGLILITKKKFPVIKNKYIWLIGLTNALGVVAQYYSISYLGPITVGLIGRFYIVFSLVLSVFLLKEKILKKDIAPILLCILGSFFVVDTNASFSNMTGIVLAFSYTFLFALTNILAKKLIGSIDSTTLLLYNQMISTLLIGVFLMGTGQGIFEYVYNANIIYLIISAFCSGFLGLILFYQGLKYIDFSKANIIRSLSPVVTFIVSYPFFPVPITVKFAVGGIMIILSIILLNYRPKKVFSFRRTKSITQH